MEFKVLFSTQRFHVEHRVYHEGGERPIERYVVVHPGAVVVLPLLGNDKVLMIRQHRRAIGEEIWEFPAGTLEPGEEPIETAKRELAEETGYAAKRLDAIARFYTSPGIMTERMHAFAAYDLSWVGQKLESSERIKVYELEMARLRRMFLDGEIADGKTLALLGLYFARQGD